ncbi:MAG: winged helix-turn-helix domain-containing protein [Nitrospirota bacterium]
MRPYGNQKQLERRRRRAILLLKKTENLLAVAKKIGCSVSSVFRWWLLYQKEGTKGLAPKPVPGRPPKLSKKQKEKLVKLLLRGAIYFGYSTDLWTTRRVQELIWKQFHIHYHPNHIWRLLISLGWSCQRPERRARERNEETIAYWKRYRWPHIKKGQKAWCPSRFPR